jgi:hypothetical protein
MEVLPVDAFCDAAIPIIRRSVNVENETHLRLWQEHFGVSPVVVCSVWNRMSLWCCLPEKCRPKHLLWTLLFLKVYATELILATLCGCDPETYRGWVKSVLEGLNRLQPFVVRINNNSRRRIADLCFNSSDIRLTENSIHL